MFCSRLRDVFENHKNLNLVIKCQLWILKNDTFIPDHELYWFTLNPKPSSSIVLISTPVFMSLEVSIRLNWCCNSHVLIMWVLRRAPNGSKAFDLCANSVSGKCAELKRPVWHYCMVEGHFGPWLRTWSLQILMLRLHVFVVNWPRNVLHDGSGSSCAVIVCGDVYAAFASDDNCDEVLGFSSRRLELSAMG